MKNYKTILIYLILIFFVSCKTKHKVVETRKEIKIDSTIKNVIQPVKSVLEINTLCDTLGVAREYINKIETGNTTTSISIKDNKLTVGTKSDSIVYVDKIVKEEIYVDREKEVVRNRTPFWHWILHVVFLLYVLVSLRIIKL